MCSFCQISVSCESQLSVCFQTDMFHFCFVCLGVQFAEEAEWFVGLRHMPHLEQTRSAQVRSVRDTETRRQAHHR